MDKTVLNPTFLSS